MKGGQRKRNGKGGVETKQGRERRIPTLGRLLRDGATDEGSGSVGGDLSRDPDLAGGFDGLGVGACGCRGAISRLDRWTGDGSDLGNIVCRVTR